MTFVKSASISALERRSRRIGRQPVAIRHRSRRVLSRVGVLLAFDLGAYFAARVLAPDLLGTTTVFGGSPSATVGPLAVPGAPASLVFPITLFAALLLTASYARHRSPIVIVRIFAGVQLASAATAIALATVLGVRDAILYASGFGLVCFAMLAVGRALSEAFAVHVWPRDRGLIPAVGLCVRIREPVPEARSWGDYGIVGTVELRQDPDLPVAFRRLHEFAEDQDAETVIARDPLPDQHLVALVHDCLLYTSPSPRD